MVAVEIQFSGQHFNVTALLYLNIGGSNPYFLLLTRPIIGEASIVAVPSFC